MLAAGHSSELNPFADISLASIEPACPPTDDGCGPIQHESFALTIEGNAGQIHSREFVQIGQFGVWAERLTHFSQPPPQCRDVPFIWRSLGLLRLAE
ncbi:hypothetical protein OV203_27675 [Nannocystis sp. ILAH1]|uniref:hypothetical protein n=1 Tax=unclassified Nannocystis TaxID=2627009 RepID=UPI0022709EB0|nr:MULTISPECIES: hypothetical protein [unclassified Nannocystis]MCY0990956.1 hypothetical protein [Nannocystis sp. ILAH1]MCY1064458.1 hypothetical protein [Nannocystis sp. RBIL2]